MFKERRRVLSVPVRLFTAAILIAVSACAEAAQLARDAEVAGSATPSTSRAPDVMPALCVY